MTSNWTPKANSHRIAVSRPFEPKSIQWALGLPRICLCVVPDPELASYYSGTNINEVINALRLLAPDKTITVF